ncbi:hypothetical protein HK099_000244 [Clydaea vesicula]|uniref:Uncharacterized protein n=1 Tax=Clydaea vesicula TaxID=447962 RepID=A0AAD5TUX2_9FUNG|nr:hypothetical protein HK099_000244 [Clydaea vesicula]KAJ3385216.1 hypothetical protein HDU92_003148 [Lobulomyces angularis]
MGSKTNKKRKLEKENTTETSTVELNLTSEVINKNNTSKSNGTPKEIEKQPVSEKVQKKKKIKNIEKITSTEATGKLESNDEILFKKKKKRKLSKDQSTDVKSHKHHSINSVFHESIKENTTILNDNDTSSFDENLITAQFLHTTTEQAKVSDKGETKKNNIFIEDKTVVNVDLKSLISGEQSSFSLFGNLNNQLKSDSILEKVSANRNVDERDNANEQNVDFAKEQEILQSFSTSKFFFFHLNSSDKIKERSIYSEDLEKQVFKRTKDLDGINETWEKNKKELTYDFKSKHKAALKKLTKMKRAK